MTDGPILLVDDNKRDVALTIRAIKKSQISHDLVVMHDGSEALDYLFGAGAYIHRDVRRVPWIILLDLKLPRVDGLQTLAHLRANQQTMLVPVIIFSSSDEEQDVAASYRLGANSYVRKPTSFVELTRAIERLHVYWQMNEVASPRRAS
ncbi:response regulator [Sorangium sp. So ce1036]|uniref:response regulator n=1 Tax=Sorangium sp. So ce1036 TaxID=3133328 RepID=UPI003F0B471A